MNPSYFTWIIQDMEVGLASGQFLVMSCKIQLFVTYSKLKSMRQSKFVWIFQRIQDKTWLIQANIQDILSTLDLDYPPVIFRYFDVQSWFRLSNRIQDVRPKMVGLSWTIQANPTFLCFYPGMILFADLCTTL